MTGFLLGLGCGLLAGIVLTALIATVRGRGRSAAATPTPAPGLDAASTTTARAVVVRASASGGAEVSDAVDDATASASAPALVTASSSGSTGTTAEASGIDEDDGATPHREGTDSEAIAVLKRRPHRRGLHAPVTPARATPAAPNEPAVVVPDHELIDAYDDEDEHPELVAGVELVEPILVARTGATVLVNQGAGRRDFVAIGDDEVLVIGGAADAHLAIDGPPRQAVISRDGDVPMIARLIDGPEMYAGRIILEMVSVPITPATARLRIGDATIDVSELCDPPTTGPLMKPSWLQRPNGAMIRTERDLSIAVAGLDAAVADGVVEDAIAAWAARSPRAGAWALDAAFGSRKIAHGAAAVIAGMTVIDGEDQLSVTIRCCDESEVTVEGRRSDVTRRDGTPIDRWDPVEMRPAYASDDQTWTGSVPTSSFRAVRLLFTGRFGKLQSVFEIVANDAG